LISKAILPPPVLPGARIGVAALSGPVDPARLEAGFEALEAMGFQPVPAENLRSKHGLFAGSDAERLEGFHRLAADPSLSAIVFARGGHGMLRVLEGIHWPTLARHPRAYVGYSDVTPFLLEVVRRLGIVTFHGPMVAADFARGLSDEEQESFLGSLAGDFPRSLAVPCWERKGVAEGPLLGGCLSLLASTLGSQFAPTLQGSILFWEDVAEPLYRLDRMLTHLRLSGSLDGISAMLIGHIVWGEEDLSPEESWRRLADEITAGTSWPVAGGLRCGHSTPNMTLPLGIHAKLRPKNQEVILGED